MLESLEDRLTPAIYDLAINPAQSNVVYSQTGVLATQPQAPGSHSAAFGGQMIVDFEPASLSFLSPAIAEAIDTPGPFLPGNVPADLASNIGVGGAIRLRQNNLAIIASGTSSPTLGGLFAGASLQLSSLYTLSLFGSTATDMITIATTSDPIEASLVFDVLTLRIPFEFRESSEFAGLTTDLSYRGVIVATGRQAGPTGSDLSMSSAAAPTSANPGETISLGWSVSNTGNAAADQLWKDMVVLSTDSTYDLSDIVLVPGLNRPNTGPLAPNVSYTVTPRSATIPANVTPGSYFLLFVADADNTQPELSDTNNVVARAISILDTTRPTVTRLSPTGSIEGPWSALEVEFSEPILASSVSVTDFSLRSPSEITVSAASVDFLSNKRVRVSFPEQRTPGNYRVTIGPDILDLAGNAMSASFTSTIELQIPDAAVDALAVPSLPLEFGASIPISWNLQNLGNRGTTVQEELWLRSVSGSVSRLLQSQSVSLAAGAELPRSSQVTLPIDGMFTTGSYFFEVVLDSTGIVFEANEANNRVVSDNVIISRPTLANLSVTSVVSPLEATPGSSVQLSWATNIVSPEKIPVGRRWVEEVWISRDRSTNTPADDARLSQLTFDVSSTGDGNRSTPATIPNLGYSGDTWFYIKIDALNAVSEEDETNNATLSSASTRVIANMLITLSPNQVQENAGPTSVRAVLTRNGDVSLPLNVTLNSSDTSEATVPATVSFGVGQASISFDVIPVQDGELDGAQLVTITATAPGFDPASSQVTVIDSDTPNLGISLATTTAVEGEAVQLVVERQNIGSTDLVVSLSTKGVGQITLPLSVVIPAGAMQSVPVSVPIVDDSLLELTQIYTITASAIGFRSATESISILESDIPLLSLTLNAVQLTEGGTGSRTIARVTRTTPSVEPQDVQISASESGVIAFPSRVTIPANATLVEFSVAALGNRTVDGNRTLDLTATPLTSGVQIAVPSASTTASLVVLENDGPALSVSLARSTLREGQTTTGTVRRNTSDVAASMRVFLNSNDTTEATVPGFVDIPAGASTASFNVTSLADQESDGTQQIEIAAVAEGFATGLGYLSVVDVDIPDLTIQNVSVPQQVGTEQRFTVSWQLTNAGLAPVTSEFVERVYFSRDNNLDSGDTYAGQVIYRPTDSATGPLDPGEVVTRIVNLDAPFELTPFYVIVVTDVLSNVEEASESNNQIESTLISVVPSYRAEISLEVQQPVAGLENVGLAGGPIRFFGGAVASYDDATPIPNADVAIRVSVQGTIREYFTRSSADGSFEYTWTPLPTEGGQYQVWADHPSVPAADTPLLARKSFSIVGLRAVATSSPILPEAAAVPTSVSVDLRNLASIPLTGVSVAVLSKPANIAVDSISLPADFILAGLASASFAVNLRALDASLPGGEIRLSVETNEGVTQELSIFVGVAPLVPNLLLDLSQLNAGAVIGTRSLLEFNITNAGGRRADKIDIRLPALSWLRVVAAPSSLEAGDDGLVTLELNPPVDLPLTDYTGRIAVNALDATNNVVNQALLPFRFRALSEAKGDLAIRIVDEYTYFVAEQPLVSNARVRLIDVRTGVAVRTEQDDVIVDGDGLVTFAGVPEGYYRLRIEADRRDTYDATILIKPGPDNRVQAFLSRQTVSYTWTVTPTTIPDRTSIQIQSTFETNVPAPVVVVENSVIDLAGLVNVGDSMQHEIRVSNEGLIAAFDVEVNLGSHPLYDIIPLVSGIDVLGPKQTIVIPVLVTKTGTIQSQPVARMALTGGQTEIPCSVPGDISAGYKCGEQLIRKVVPTLVINAEGNCKGGPIFPPVTPPPPVRPPVRPPKNPTDPGFVPTPKPKPPRPAGPSTPSGGGGYIDPFVTSYPPTIYEPPEPPKCDCDPEEWTVSAEGSVLASQVKAAARRLADAISLISPFGSVSAEVDVFGELTMKECCDSQGRVIGTSVKGEASVSGKLIVGLGFQVNKELDLPVPINGLSGEIDIEGKIGAFVELMVTGKVSLDVDCDGKNKFCVRLDVAADVLLGGELDEIEIEIETDSGIEIETPEVSGFFGLRGTVVSAFIELCDDGIDADACIGPLEAGIEIIIPISGEDYEIDFSEEVLRKRCLSGLFSSARQNSISTRDVQSEEFTELFDSDVFARDLGYQSSQQLERQLGLSSLGETIDYNELRLIRRSALTNPLDQGICSEVSFAIDQQAVITRDAFDANLEIANNTDSTISDVNVQIDVRDASGSVATDLFGIVLSRTSGLGDGASVPSGGTAGLGWTIIPSSDAAPDGPTTYYVGGRLSYLDNGQLVEIELANVPITVLPNASLSLKYFQERDVLGDDPFTVETEPSVPFTLAVLATNSGRGTAQDLTIVSEQPRIIENERGLLVDFNIVGSRVQDQPVSSSLTVDMGDVLPDETKQAQWLLTSPIQGLFTDYDASFEHLDGLGNPRLAIINSVEIHELIRVVDAGGLTPGGEQDSLSDYLTNDLSDIFDSPDTLHLSDGTVVNVNEASAVSLSRRQITGEDRDSVLSADMPSGWGYVNLIRHSDPLNLDDPGFATSDPSELGYRLVGVKRSDGSLLPSRNFWQTDRTFVGNGNRPIYERNVHILDFNDAEGRQSYNLIYEPIDAVPPSVLDIIDVAPDPRNSPVDAIVVEFSKAINLASFTFDDMRLSRNGGDNLIDSQVSVEAVEGSATRFQIEGLAGLTTPDGEYQFIIDATGISDGFGNSGLGIAVEDWTNGDAVLRVTSIGGVNGTVLPGGIDYLDVTFNRPISISTLSNADVTLRRDGGGDLLESPFQLSVANLGNNTYRLTGLGTSSLTALTQAPGEYRFGIETAGIQDTGNAPGVRSAGVAWRVDSDGPDIEELRVNRTAEVGNLIGDVSITFDEEIDTTSFTLDDITLRMEGSNDNLLANGGRLDRISSTRFQLSGLAGLGIQPANFELQIDLGGVRDAFGIAGQGLFTRSIDRLPPRGASELQFAAPATLNGSDWISPSSQVTIQGSLDETGLLVTLFDETLNESLGFGNVSGQRFSRSLRFDVPGVHRIRVDVIDPAGNRASSFTSLLIDEATALRDTSAPFIVRGPSVDGTARNSSVNSVELEFSEPILASTFTLDDVSLTVSGGPNLIGEGIEIIQVSPTLFRIEGLSSITTEEGRFALSVQMSSVSDLAGNPGSSRYDASWIMDTTAPVSEISELPAFTFNPEILITLVGDDGGEVSFRSVEQLVIPSCGCKSKAVRQSVRIAEDGSDVSGIVAYDIYVSEDDGEFTFWRTLSSTEPAAFFRGELNRGYAFYSVARDAAGNFEVPPVTPDAAIFVVGAGIVPVVQPIDDVTIDEGESLEVDVITDLVVRGEVRYQLADGSPIGMTIDGETGKITWTPSNSATSPFSVNVNVFNTLVPSLISSIGFNVTVNNVPPTIQIAGPNEGVVGQILEFEVSASDPIESDLAWFGIEVDWDGDGTFDRTYLGSEGLGRVSHAFDSSGVYSVAFRALDADGSAGPTSTEQVKISNLASFENPEDPQLRDLLLSGTNNRDEIVLRQLDDTSVEVTIRILDGREVGTTEVFINVSGVIRVYGLAGDDRIDGSSLTSMRMVVDSGDGDDTIIGGDSNDFIDADGAEGQGNDEVIGGDGNDLIYADGSEGYDPDANAGRDTIDAGGGDDVIHGDGAEGAKSDSINAGAGDDTVYADGAEAYQPKSTIGQDTVAGGEGDDILITDGAEGGVDLITGDAGNDLIDAGGGNDTISGGSDRDIIMAGKGADHFNGDAGSDLIIAGYTSLDVTSLQLIQAEWLSPRTIEARAENILSTGTGPRNNGDAFLNADNTTISDGAIDSIFGGEDEDWFLVDMEEDEAIDFDPALDLVLEPGV